MSERTEETRQKTEEKPARDRAIGAFLDLAERLSAFSGGERRDASQLPASSAIFEAMQREIIPRFMLLHRSRGSERQISAPIEPVISADEHHEFLEIIMKESASAAHAFFDCLLARDVACEDLFVDLLATAARSLGRLWEEDKCDFTDVTIGLCRLHEVLRRNSVSYDDANALSYFATNQPSVLLTTACNDQHVFGISLVGEFFRRDGWQTWSEFGSESDQVADVLSENHFDILAVSAAFGTHADDITEELKLFRARSLNQNIKILIGGKLFVDYPDLVAKVGADATSTDAKSAPETASQLLAAHRVHC